MSSNGCTPDVPDIEYLLVDFEMPVGQTGIVFVAALEARLMSWGPVFQTVATLAAYRRAASTLAHMALISGATFEFMRQAIEFSTAQAGAFVGVSEATVQAWEAGTEPVPTNIWYLFADYVCAKDGREFCPYLTLPEQDFRARRIRVYPDVPRTGTPQPPPDCPC